MPFWPLRRGSESEAAAADERDRSGSLTESSRPRTLQTSASIDESEEPQRRERRPSVDFPSQLNTDFIKVADTNEKLSLSMNMNYFAPSEIEVKNQGDELIVQGRHDYEDEYGPVLTREFERRYKLPGNVNAQSLRSHISRDGRLLIEASKLSARPM